MPAGQPEAVLVMVSPDPLDEENHDGSADLPHPVLRPARTPVRLLVFGTKGPDTAEADRQIAQLTEDRAGIGGAVSEGVV